MATMYGQLSGTEVIDTGLSWPSCIINGISLGEISGFFFSKVNEVIYSLSQITVKGLVQIVFEIC